MYQLQKLTVPIMHPDRACVVCQHACSGQLTSSRKVAHRGVTSLGILQVEGSVFLSGTKAGEPIADGILAVANKMDVDVLVMGISGYG